MKRQDLRTLVERNGQKYSELLGIDLSGGRDDEVFKWFLASVLFGASITESSAIKTYRCFLEHGVSSPRLIIKTGWDGLVKILDEGSYARYDFKTADKLLKVSNNLLEKHGGSLASIHSQSVDARDLEVRLRRLGKGVGEVTVSIFLREMRGIWGKADPKPTMLEIQAAESLGIVKKDVTSADALVQLKAYWLKNKVPGKSFVNFETALVRLGKDLRKKKKRFAAGQ